MQRASLLLHPSVQHRVYRAVSCIKQLPKNVLSRYAIAVCNALRRFSRCIAFSDFSDVHGIFPLKSEDIFAFCGLFPVPSPALLTPAQFLGLCGAAFYKRFSFPHLSRPLYRPTDIPQRPPAAPNCAACPRHPARHAGQRSRAHAGRAKDRRQQHVPAKQPDLLFHSLTSFMLCSAK